MKNLCDLSEQEQNELVQHAANYMSLSALAEIMEVDEAEFREAYEMPGNVVRQCVRKGRLLTQSEIQKALVTSAKNGSNPAQEKMLQIITRINNEEEIE